jgi:hypothetical protein
MDFNAFIVDWTVSDYDGLKEKLTGAGFVFEREGTTPHIRVRVPFDRVQVFAALCQEHMNAPFNYVDVQYPDRKTTVIVFQTAVHFITNREENERVKAQAINMGLPPDQADWATSY